MASLQINQLRSTGKPKAPTNFNRGTHKVNPVLDNLFNILLLHIFTIDVILFVFKAALNCHQTLAACYENITRL